MSLATSPIKHLALFPPSHPPIEIPIEALVMDT